MRCPFVLKTPNGYCCELMKEAYGPHRPVVSAWKCKHDDFMTCPEYLERMLEMEEKEESQAAYSDFNFLGITIRHVNRIGGPRALFEHLL